jgi:hypothetical protein
MRATLVRPDAVPDELTSWAQPSPAGTAAARIGLQGGMKRNGLVTSTAGPRFRTGCARSSHTAAEQGCTDGDLEKRALSHCPRYVRFAHVWADACGVARAH